MLHLVTRAYVCMFPLLMLLPLGGCLLDEEPPPINPTKPATCGNGTCDVNKAEDCINCPKDCDCCALVFGGGVSNGQTIGAAQIALVAGQPDGKSLTLSGYSELELAIGGSWFDATGAAPDFTIHGTVTTSQALNSGCNTSGGTGGFEVWGRHLTGDYKLIGVWTGASKSFNISCTQLSEIRYLRLRSQGGAEGQLDAITADPQSCLTGSGTP